MKTVLITALFLQLILVSSGQNVLACPRIRVFFEIDSSLSVTQSNFNDEIDLVRSLINGIRHSTGSEAGFILFNSEVILSSLSPLSTDLTQQLSRLNSLALTTNATSFTNALRYANETVFSEFTSVTDPRNILVLLTDGLDDSADNAVLTAISNSLTDDKATTVVVVAFGSISNTAQLDLIASNGGNNLQVFSDSQEAAANFQTIFTAPGICTLVPLLAPTNPNAINIEPRSLTITWTPAASPVTGYRVCYTTITNADLNNVCENSVDTGIISIQQTIVDLIPFTLYTYAVFSINNNLELGSSIESERTTQTGSSVPVRMLSATVNSYNSATVSWVAPVLQGRNGIITEYEICFLPAGEEACIPLSLVDDAMLTYTTNSLTANTEYRVRVTPINSVAVQERGMADETSFTTPQFPSVVLQTAEALSATEISATWTQPSYSVNSYVLTATNGNNVITVLPTGSQTTFIIPNASPFTEYTIAILAQTDNGPSLSSNTLLVQTLESAPTGQVRSLSAMGLEPTSIQVNFTEPPSNLLNGIPIAYFICVRNVPGERCVQAARVDFVESISIVIGGLISDTQYNVSVLVINGFGNGPEICTLTTTPAADISPVFNLEGVQTGARQISLQWENPPEALDSSLVGGIRVCFGMVGQDCQFMRDVLATETSTNITLPEPINPYFIAVSLLTPTGSRGVPDTILVPINIVEVSSLRSDGVSTSEIVVAWTAPIVPLEFTLLSYSVYVRLDGGIGFERSFTPNNETLTIVVEGLNQDQQYETVVFPVIQEDFFIRNQTSTARTFPASPDDAPLTVSVDFALSTVLRISWTAPVSPNGNIVAYEVSYEGTELDTRGVRLVNASDGLLFRTLTGLEEAETYLIRVTAVYDGDRGVSLQVRGTTLEDVPSEPISDLVAVANNDYVQVSWTAPPLLYRNGIISSYDIICDYDEATLADTVNTVDGAVTSATLHNLEAGTSCNITVIPYTQEGAGPESNAVRAATQALLNVIELCNAFRISLSVITIIAAILLAVIVLLIAIMVVHYFRDHHSPLAAPGAPGVELYANPRRV